MQLKLTFPPPLLLAIAVHGWVQALTAYGEAGKSLRRQCQRVGNHFTGSRYVGREHLLPVPNPKLVSRLVALEAERPGLENVVAYARCSEESLRRGTHCDAQCNRMGRVKPSTP